jgi:mutator protein MutT
MSDNYSSLPHKKIGVAVIRDRQGKILIDRRRLKGSMGGLWEFPGGKIEERETPEECIKREIREELAIEVEVGARLIAVNHNYESFQVTLYVHYCEHLQGEPQPIECEEIRWVTLEEIEHFNFPEANWQIINALKNS